MGRRVKAIYGKFIKRIFDLTFAIILLPLLGLIVLITGIFIWLEDLGPIFYSSKRLGKNGKVFIMYKLRTMKVNAPDVRNEDGSTFNSVTDPRLTHVGRLIRQTSIDEIPQIINVIKGDMSFIGPRPGLPDHLVRYTDEEKRKLLVCPGITGFNQAFYRNCIPLDKRLKNDIFYVENISISFDIRILIQTLWAVTTQKNIFSA
jgi:lipopolysaccharide/colanic/teichoic acid biosynthesis glycosyltransferase